MPVDEQGNRADIVMDPNSIISRMNLGCLYEQYINAASRDVSKKIRFDLQCVAHEKGLETKLSKIANTTPELFDRTWEYLLGYYAIVSPKMHVWFTSGEYHHPIVANRRNEWLEATTYTKACHLASIINEGIYLYLPPDNEPESEDIIKELDRYYRPLYGPVTYVGNSGERHITKNPVRIGSVYIILLEKTGDDWTAVSSGKIQHYGVLSQVTNSDKYSQPGRIQAIRALGESEVRIYVSYTGALFTADILDRNNNPATHKQILYNIFEANRPTDIHSAVNRETIPLGGAKPLQLVNHILACSGLRFVYAPHVSEFSQKPF